VKRLVLLAFGCTCIAAQPLNRLVTEADCTAASLVASIAQTTIGEPVRSVTLQAAWVGATDTVPVHCRIDGVFAPVDTSPTARVINFRVILPASWNGRAAQLGGGGVNGIIPNLTSVKFGAAGPSLFARGFVTYGSDSGHQARSHQHAAWLARANLNAAQGGGAMEIVLRVRRTGQPIDPLAHRRRPEQRVGRNIHDKAQSRFLVGEATSARGILGSHDWLRAFESRLADPNQSRELFVQVELGSLFPDLWPPRTRHVRRARSWQTGGSMVASLVRRPDPGAEVCSTASTSRSSAVSFWTRRRTQFERPAHRFRTLHERGTTSASVRPARVHDEPRIRQTPRG
jgi:hypothetical protein